MIFNFDHWQLRTWVAGARVILYRGRRTDRKLRLYRGGSLTHSIHELCAALKSLCMIRLLNN